MRSVNHFDIFLRKNGLYNLNLDSIILECSSCQLLQFDLDRCTLALLTKELEKAKYFGVEPLGNHEEGGPSLKLEKWLNQFERFINFIDEVNDCFKHIMTFTLLHTCVFTSR